MELIDLQIVRPIPEGENAVAAVLRRFARLTLLYGGIATAGVILTALVALQGFSGAIGIVIGSVVGVWLVLDVVENLKNTRMFAWYGAGLRSADLPAMGGDSVVVTTYLRRARFYFFGSSLVWWIRSGRDVKESPAAPAEEREERITITTVTPRRADDEIRHAEQDRDHELSHHTEPVIRVHDEEDGRLRWWRWYPIHMAVVVLIAWIAHAHHVVTDSAVIGVLMGVVIGIVLIAFLFARYKIAMFRIRRLLRRK